MRQYKLFEQTSPSGLVPSEGDSLLWDPDAKILSPLKVYRLFSFRCLFNVSTLKERFPRKLQGSASGGV